MKVVTFSVRAVKKWNILNVDLKRSSNVKICKRSLFKSILNSQMLTHSPNVNYFHKVFNNFLVLKVLVLNIAFLVF